MSTSTSKLPFLVFLTFFGLALVDITFSIRKSENLPRHTSSKDSITMNLGKSAALFSDSERFRLFFLFEDAIYAVYFSLALRSSTHHGVQLVLGINQGVTHSSPTANRWPHWGGGLTTLQRCSRRILQPQPTGRFNI